MTVAEYADEFHTLSHRAEIDEPEYITMGRHMGFTKLIIDILRLYTIYTITEAFQDATQLENILATNTAFPLHTFTKSSNNQKAKPITQNCYITWTNGMLGLQGIWVFER